MLDSKERLKGFGDSFAFDLQIGRPDEFDYMIIPKGLQALVLPEYGKGQNQTHCKLKVDETIELPDECLNGNYLCPKGVKKYCHGVFMKAIKESESLRSTSRRITLCK